MLAADQADCCNARVAMPNFVKPVARIYFHFSARKNRNIRAAMLTADQACRM